MDLSCCEDGFAVGDTDRAMATLNVSVLLRGVTIRVTADTHVL